MKLGPHHNQHRPTEGLPDPPFYPDDESINFPEGRKYILKYSKYSDSHLFANQWIFFI